MNKENFKRVTEIGNRLEYVESVLVKLNNMSELKVDFKLSGKVMPKGYREEIWLTGIIMPSLVLSIARDGYLEEEKSLIAELKLL